MPTRRICIGALAISLSAWCPIAFSFEPPPSQDAPHSTAGGGSRPGSSACVKTATSAHPMALAPRNFIGLSESAMPTLWLQVPTRDIETVEISVFDENLQGLAQTQISLVGQTGFVPVRLPEGFQLLPDKPYYWSAAFVCNPLRRPEDWVVGGWIKLQPLSFAEQQTFRALSNEARINRYLERGYWYTAVADILLLRQNAGTQKPLDSAWSKLLQQAGLNEPRVFPNDGENISE